jgi:sugar lactone lactonase YvrE
VNIEVFAKQENLLGESPVWRATESALYWLDIGRKQLHRKLCNGEQACWALPARPGCVESLSGGSLAFVGGSGLYKLDPKTGETHFLRKIVIRNEARFNEGKSDPHGRLWFGSMQDNFGMGDIPLPVERSIGRLFCLDQEGRLRALEKNIGIANTLAWSPDERRFYFADSLANRIFLYDYTSETGVISNKRVFFEATGLGLPDGSAMDVDGCLWNARWGAGCVVRITPGGLIDRKIAIPALQATSCAFGGAKLETLFVTSAKIGLSPKALTEWPCSGSVFAITGLAQGLPISPFKFK